MQNRGHIVALYTVAHETPRNNFINRKMGTVKFGRFVLLIITVPSVLTRD